MTENPLLKAAIGLLLVAYPALVYFGLQLYSPRLIVLVLLLLATLRWVMWRSDELRNYLLFAALLLAVMTYLSGSAHGLLFYPVVMNLGFLALFAFSLRNPPSVIEKIARRMEGELPHAAVSYTRSVTKVWCAFFLLNALIALTTVFTSQQAWALYNGLIAYLLMGLLMFIEYIFRRRHKRRHGA